MENLIKLYNGNEGMTGEYSKILKYMEGEHIGLNGVSPGMIRMIAQDDCWQKQVKSNHVRMNKNSSSYR